MTLNIARAIGAAAIAAIMLSGPCHSVVCSVEDELAALQDS